MQAGRDKIQTTFVVSDMPPSCNSAEDWVNQGTTKGKKVPASLYVILLLFVSSQGLPFVGGIDLWQKLVCGRSLRRANSRLEGCSRSARIVSCERVEAQTSSCGISLARRCRIAIVAARRVKPKDSKNSSSPVKVKTKDLVQGKCIPGYVE